MRRLREQAMETIKAADDLERSAEGPPFCVGVSWPTSGAANISFDDRVVPHGAVEELAAQCIWALFESRRDSADPSDRRTFDWVAARVMGIAAGKCHQAAPPKRSEEEKERSDTSVPGAAAQAGVNPPGPARDRARRLIAAARADGDVLDFGSGLEAKIMAALEEEQRPNEARTPAPWRTTKGWARALKKAVDLFDEFEDPKAFAECFGEHVDYFRMLLEQHDAEHPCPEPALLTPEISEALMQQVLAFEAYEERHERMISNDVRRAVLHDALVQAWRRGAQR
ncbi:MAG: hypothetical protein KF782_15420 [Labilithrix sp.]|nr:hypothetical protein [Labilithrix sp.]